MTSGEGAYASECTARAVCNSSHDDFHKSAHLHESSSTYILSTHSYPISLRPILILYTEEVWAYRCTVLDRSWCR
jgi:hypothetical protein